MHDLGVANRHVGIGRCVWNAVVGKTVANSQEIRADSVRRYRRKKALLDRIHDRPRMWFGNAADRVGFVKAILRWLWQLGEFAERSRNSKRLCTSYGGVFVLRSKRQAS